MPAMAADKRTMATVAHHNARLSRSSIDCGRGREPSPQVIMTATTGSKPTPPHTSRPPHRSPSARYGRAGA